MKSDRKNVFTRLLLGGVGVHGPVRGLCRPGLPYALSGPLQDSTRKTTNDSKCTSLPSLFSFFCCNKHIERARSGPPSVCTPDTHTPGSLEGAALPPGGASGTVLPALWRASEKEQVLQASFSKANPRIQMARNISQPRWSRPFVNSLGSFRYDRTKPCSSR